MIIRRSTTRSMLLNSSRLALALLATSLFFTAPISAAEQKTVPAQRIVSLAPHLTELAYAAGVGEQLIAVDRYSNYPPQVKQLAKISDAFTLNRELLSILKPDLVLAWRSGNPSELLRPIQQAGIALLILEPAGLASIADDIRRIGRHAGQDKTAERAAKSYEQALRQIRARYGKNKQQKTKPLRVFFQVSASPLFSVNGEHIINELIEDCGGENIVAAAPVLAPMLSIEAVLAGQPDVIIAGASGSSVQTDEKAASHPSFQQWQRWPQIPAVAKQQFLLLDADQISRATPRILFAMEAVCSYLYELSER